MSAATEMQEAPQPQVPEDKITHQLTITVYESGRASISGPIDRNLIVMLLTTGFDLSYEAEKQRGAQLAEAQRLANQPPPKKWSKAWWAAQFAAKRAAQGGQLSAADETSARLMAAKTEGLDAAPNDKINGHDDRVPAKGPVGGMPEGSETKH